MRLVMEEGGDWQFLFFCVCKGFNISNNKVKLNKVLNGLGMDCGILF